MYLGTPRVGDIALAYRIIDGAESDGPPAGWNLIGYASQEAEGQPSITVSNEITAEPDELDGVYDDR